MVNVVTADGERLRASADEHPDLFWALRGGGGNFGVVTSFEFRLHPVGPTVLAGPIMWDASDTADVLRFYRDFVRDAPDALGTVVRFGTAPPLSDVPENLHWRPVVMIGSCYAGPIEKVRRCSGRSAHSGSPAGPCRVNAVEFQSALDSTVMHGWNYYWKSTHLPELRDDLIHVIAEHAFSSSSKRSAVAMFHLEGAVSRVADGATAFGNRQASHAITLDGVWRPGEDFGERDTAWAKTFLAALNGYRGRLRQLHRRRRAPGPDPRGRQRCVRPTGGCEDHMRSDNVFHYNQNIRPRLRSARLD